MIWQVRVSISVKVLMVWGSTETISCDGDGGEDLQLSMSRTICGGATNSTLVSVTLLSATSCDGNFLPFIDLTFIIGELSGFNTKIFPCSPFAFCLLLTPFAWDTSEPLEEYFLPDDSKLPSPSFSFSFFLFFFFAKEACNALNFLEKNLVLPLCSPFTSC